MSEEKVEKLLKVNPSGLTITEIVERSNISRSLVRTILAKLEGAKKVDVRKVGMAKVYFLRGEK